MSEVHLRPPEDLIRRIRAVKPLRFFVETGTYYGETARWASERFEHVWTTEFSDECYKGAIEKSAGVENVSFLYGDSRAVLPKVLAELEEEALFWLDAHYSGNETYGKSDECPLLEEISIVNRSKYENAIIIDDARFLSPAAAVSSRGPVAQYYRRARRAQRGPAPLYRDFGGPHRRSSGGSPAAGSRILPRSCGSEERGENSARYTERHHAGRQVKLGAVV